MRYEQFKDWMIESNRLSSRPIADTLSRCKRIEKIPGIDLDTEYMRDGGFRIIEKLTYTSNDEREHRSVPKELEFSPTANLRNGMTSLKNAAKLYFEFCRSGNKPFDR